MRPDPRVRSYRRPHASRHSRGHPVARDARMMVIPRLTGFGVAAFIVLPGGLPLDIHLVALLAVLATGIALLAATLRGATRRMRRYAFDAGMALDLLVLVLLLHLTGGLQSPLLSMPLMWAALGILAYRGLTAMAYTVATAATIGLQPLLERAWHAHPPIGGSSTLGMVTVLLILGLAASIEIAARTIERNRNSLRALAHLDPLTATGNRRAFDQRLEQLSDPDTGAYALALIDLDHFKRLNDEHGHHTGDQALTVFADRLGSQLRTSDELYRVGGEEFAVILPHTTATDACHILTRVQQRLREHLHEDLPAPVTFSAGISDHTHPEPYLDADQLLYQAKRAGRDQIRCNQNAPATKPSP